MLKDASDLFGPVGDHCGKCDVWEAKKVFQLTCVHPALNVQLRFLRLDESKGDEKSDGKLPHKVICSEKSGLYS